MTNLSFDDDDEDYNFNIKKVKPITSLCEYNHKLIIINGVNNLDLKCLICNFYLKNNINFKKTFGNSKKDKNKILTSVVNKTIPTTPPLKMRKYKK
jgi:hypothetical protein